MFVFDKIDLPTLGLTGLEADLTEEERAIQGMAHRFAEEVMRPIGKQLDEMTPEEVIAPESPLWSYAKQLQEAGILDLGAMLEMDKQQKARILPLIFEEMGWGDSGLTIFSLATAFPAFVAHTTGDPELIEQFGSKIGCWLATQPDRGSDLVDFDASELHPGTKHNRGNLIARVEGDEVILSGQSSAWVSGAPVAQCGLVYCQCDFGDGEGLHNKDGGLNYIAMLVDFDLPGVSKGKPLDKLGQRALPQGEVYFDEVRIPKKYVIAGKDEAFPSFFGALTFGNMEMGFTFTGVARAAFEHALDYVHERKQGGTAIINHQTVRARIFDMWQKVETARAMAHRVGQYNYSENGPHLLASITSKTYVTKMAFEVANESIQIFGGNGLTKEYPVEKVMRDARASMIEDGESNVLNLKGASWLSKWYRDKNGL